MPRTTSKTRRRYYWRTWSDRKLLDLRFRDLGVRLEGTWIEKRVRRLYEELEQRDLRLRPHVWLSDEWFSPSGVPGVAIPFYLAHPRLMRLERSQMLEVEGGTERECQQILRHEAGHAFLHAYRLNRRRTWQKLFGKSSKKYPEYYRPNPASKRFVQHLGFWYAQSHPEEDWAESFAVWLRPRSDWRRRYADWPALKKLRYVDEVMAEVGGRAPLVRSRERSYLVSRLSKSLADHYRDRRRKYDVAGPDIWDNDLRRLFPEPSGRGRTEAASAFLRRNRAEIRRMVSKWTGEYQYTLNTILEGMIDRCRSLKLRAGGPAGPLKLDFAVLLTVKTMHYLYSLGRREWLPL